MDLITADIERALLYTFALNESDITPTAEEVNKFVTTKLPKAATTTSLLTQRFSASMGALLSSSWVAGEPVSKYMVSMGWVSETPSGGLRITSSGQALITFQQREPGQQTGGVSVFTSTPDKPMILSHLLTLMADKVGGYYIDPWLNADNIELLYSETSIKRVLTRDNKYTSAIRARLRELNAEPTFEVRLVPESGELHDRSILHESGGVTLVGTSLNRLEGKYSVAVALPNSAAHEYYAQMVSLWNKSEPLGNEGK